MLEVCVTDDRVKIDKNSIDRIVDTMQELNHERVSEHTDKKLCKRTKKSVADLYDSLPGPAKKAVCKASEGVKDVRNAQAATLERQILAAMFFILLTGLTLAGYLGLTLHNYVGALIVTCVMAAIFVGVVAKGVSKIDTCINVGNGLNMILVSQGHLPVYYHKDQPNFTILLKETNCKRSADDTLSFLPGLRTGVDVLTSEVLNGFNVSVEVKCLVEQIFATDAELLTYCDGDGVESVLDSVNMVLAPYVKLPPDFRTEHVLSGGETVQMQIVTQLNLLHSYQVELLQSCFKQVANDVEVNGRYLQSVYGGPALTLPD